MRKFGPKQQDYPEDYPKCPACQQAFKKGDFSTLIMLGPGDNEEEQKKAKAGRPYNGVAMEVHWTCATGEKT